jgi:hypothetical protein
MLIDFRGQYFAADIEILSISSKNMFNSARELLEKEVKT